MKDTQRSKVLRGFLYGWLPKLKAEKKEYPFIGSEEDVRKQIYLMLSRYTSKATNIPIEIREQWKGKHTYAYFRERKVGTKTERWLVLQFPAKTREMPHLCYEVAHILHWLKGGQHGHHTPDFCRGFIALVRDQMGPFEAAWLLESLQKSKVRLH